MEHSKFPMRLLVYTMYLMTSIKQVLSAIEAQHQLDMLESKALGTYPHTDFLCFHK